MCIHCIANSGFSPGFYKVHLCLETLTQMHAETAKNITPEIEDC